MKRKPHVDGYYSSDGREAQRARPVQVPDDGGWPGRGEPRGSSGRYRRWNTGSGLGAVGRGVEQLTADIVVALKTVYNPEIPADIYELGLIYKIDIDDDRNVAIVRTLTAPGCPVAGEMPQWVENAVASVTSVDQVKVTLTFDPPWDKDRISDEAKLTLNMF